MRRISSGSVYRRPDSEAWYIQFSIDGDLKRESAGTSSREEAIAFLQRRIDEAAHGRYTDVDQRPTFADLEELLLENYRYKRNRTDPRQHIRRLADVFGNMKAEDITEDRIREYSLKRLNKDGMSAGTLRRELALLKRMLRLAAGRIPRVPLVDLPRVDNARQGCFEEEDVQAILPHLPAHARNLVEFLYLTGWRSSEAFRLLWSDVNWDWQFVFLRDSKSREPRIFPFKYHPRLEQVLRRQRDYVSEWEGDQRCLCPAVFHWKGRPIQKLRRSWTTACRKAGMPGRLIHDFRRTAVRNLIRAGVQQAIAMKITGHKTDSIFRRYLIVDEELLAQATGAVADLLGNPSPKSTDQAGRDSHANPSAMRLAPIPRVVPIMSPRVSCEPPLADPPVETPTNTE
jgi:integrase